MGLKNKRLPGILLILMLIFGLMQCVGMKAYASDSLYSSLIPNDSDSDAALADKQVTFNGMKWYIIEDNSSSSDTGTVTLFSKDLLYSYIFNYQNNVYKESVIDYYLQGKTKEGGEFFDVRNAIADVFLEDIGYRKLYLLTAGEASHIPVNIKKCESIFGQDCNAWWLRSAGMYSIHAQCVVNSNGYIIKNDTPVDRKLGVRPALQLDLSAVGFLSESKEFVLKKKVSLTGGSNSTISGGTLTQNRLVNEPIETVVFTAYDGYHFEEFADFSENGITVSRTSDTVVTVSGAPTYDVDIVVPNAVHNNPLTRYLNTTTTVKFNNFEWYIIEDNSSGLTSGTVTLLAKNSLGISQFDDKSNAYRTSKVKKFLDDMTVGDGPFANVANIIVDTDLPDVNVEDAKLYLLSVDEVKRLPLVLCGCDTIPETGHDWCWIRSPNGDYYAQLMHNSTFSPFIATEIDSVDGVRPALRLDLSAVIYSSDTREFIPKPISTITKLPTANTLSYNGKAQELITAGEAEGGKLYYAVTKVGANKPSYDLYSTSVPKESKIGYYDVYYYLKGDKDHSNTAPQKITVEIEKADYTGTTVVNNNIFADSIGFVPINLPKLPEEAVYSTQYSIVSDPSGFIQNITMTSATKCVVAHNKKSAGTTATFKIHVTGATHYKDYDVLVTVTATKKGDPMVSIEGGDRTVTYGDEDFILNGEVELAGANSVKWKWESNNPEVAEIDSTNGKVTIKNAGLAKIKATYTSSDREGSSTITLTVNRKTVTVKANDMKKYDDGTEPEYIATVTGLVSGESEDLINYSFKREEGTEPGTYIIIPYGATIQGNYYVEYVTGTLTIEKSNFAEISFGTGSKEVTYGDKPFTIAVSNTGDGKVSYSSDDTHVATVDSDGKVTINNVGEGYATITATVEDTDNYKYLEKTASYILIVNKADPEYPTAIKAKSGSRFRDVELPEGWSWTNTDDLDEVIPNTEGSLFSVSYTPKDPENYLSIDNYLISIQIIPADNNEDIPTPSHPTPGGDEPEPQKPSEQGQTPSGNGSEQAQTPSEQGQTASGNTSEQAQTGNESNPSQPTGSSETGSSSNEQAQSSKDADQVHTSQDTAEAQPAETVDKKQKGTSLTKLKVGKKSITVTWKKQTAKGIKGYEIQYSTDKKFKKDVKTVTVNKAKTTSKTIKKLTPKKKYYVRIRTFKKSGKEKIYSKWSKSKNVKVK